MPTCVRCALYYSDVSEYRAHWHTAHEVTPPEEDVEGEEEGDYEEEEESSEDEDSGIDPSFLPPDMLQTWLHAGAGTPKAIVHCTDSGEVYSLYRCLLQASMQQGEGEGGEGGGALGLRDEDAPPDILGTESRVPSLKAIFSPEEQWLVMLYRGGYFAGIVTQVCRVGAGSYTPKTLLHKRFARYTTRRKQGGSQSAHDASAGRPAKSIGAQIRRANEVALVQDIHCLLQGKEWRAAIGACRRVFVSCAVTTTGHLFDGSTLRKGDPRVLRVPLPTGRPTIVEAEGVARELVHISRLGHFDALVREAEGRRDVLAVATAAAAAATATAAAAATATAASVVPPVPPPSRSEALTAVAEGGEDKEEEEEEEIEGGGEGEGKSLGQPVSQQPRPAPPPSTSSKGKSGGGGGKGGGKKGKGPPKASAAPTHPLPPTDDGEDDDILAQAMKSVDDEKRAVKEALDLQGALAQLGREVESESLWLAGKLGGLPVKVLYHAIGLPKGWSAAAASAATASSSSSGAALEKAAGTLALLRGMVVDERGRRTDIDTADVFAAMGWDGLAAVVVATGGNLAGSADWESMMMGGGGEASGGGGGGGGGGGKGKKGGRK